MANYNFGVDTLYNVTPSSSQGGGLLAQDSTYQFVDSLPTGSDIRQDRFYKVNGTNTLCWWNGTEWINITDTVIKSGITEVPSLPTTSIKSDVFYRVTNTSDIMWYDPVNSEWVNVTKPYIVSLSAFPTSLSDHEQLYYINDGTGAIDSLYWINSSGSFVDVGVDNGITMVSSIPTKGSPTKLYYCRADGCLWWYEKDPYAMGTTGTWYNLSTNYGIVKVNSKPSSNIRSDCFYYATDDTDSLWWYNPSKATWLDLGEPSGIVIWDKTYPPYEMTETPSDTLLYNYLSDDSLWWYNSHSSSWVDVAKDTAIKIVTSLAAADKRQDVLYKPLYETAIYWWNGTEWYDIYKNHGVVEVASYPVSGQHTDCLYKLINDVDLMWWDGNQWINISTDNGIIKTTALPSTADATHTNLYWVKDGTANDNKLYWLNYDNEWIDVGRDDSIKNAAILPTAPDIKSLYRLSTDSHLYYYTNEWVDISDNHGVNTVTDLPNSLTAKVDRIYKKASENKLYWWNGNQWKIISDNGGMVEVTSLPSAPSDTSVLYRLTQDQYDSSGTLLYKAWIYGWINSSWQMMKASVMTADRGLSIINDKIGHSNSTITSVTSKDLYKLSFDEYGHITGYDTFTETVTGAEKGLSITNNKVGHENSITDSDTSAVYKITYDKYGHIKTTSALTSETWTFTKADGSGTVTKTIWVG